MRKGLWSPDEDERLYSHITNYGVGTWSSVAELAGMAEEEWKELQAEMDELPVPRPQEAAHLQAGRGPHCVFAETLRRQGGPRLQQECLDNEIKNYWNSRLRRRLSIDDHKSPEMRQSEGFLILMLTAAAQQLPMATLLAIRLLFQFLSANCCLMLILLCKMAARQLSPWVYRFSRAMGSTW
ncbi:hypothetical protein ACP4OV_014445 [Aristida adscensionis]